MKKIFQILILWSFAFVSASLFVHAEDTIDPMNLPGLAEYVTDFSNVLSSEDIQSLRQIARDYETKTTNQMVVVLIPDRSGNELFNIGMKIFNSNKIGQKGKNNGILLLVATDEKKIRIITGYGLEGDIPDVLASDFIERDIRPLVNDGKYSDAIRAFFTRTMAAVGTDEGKKAQQKANEEGILWTSLSAIVFGLAFSFNIFFLGFAAIFFIIASFSIGSIYPLMGFIAGMIITLFIGFTRFNPGFGKNFWEMPKNNGGG